MRTLWLAEAKQRDDIARWTAAAVKNAEAVAQRSRDASPPQTRVPATSRESGAASAPLVLNAGTCEQLVAKYFGDVLPWAQRITQRESHCSAVTNWREGCDTSGRTNSHAVGPWQLCMPLHQAAFDAVGCNAPLDLECNMKAARFILDSEGTAPWGG